MEVNILTGNDMKFRTAATVLKKYDITAIQKKMETPEIQSSDGKEVAEFAAQYAAKELGLSVVKTDVSYCIPSLGGFPGPFVKYINSWLGPEDILRLLAGKDRAMQIIEYLAFVDEKGKTHTFTTKTNCLLANKVQENNTGSTFDKLTIREGMQSPQNLLSQEELDRILVEQVKIWDALGRFLHEQ